MIAKVSPTYPSNLPENYEQEGSGTHGFPQPSVQSHNLGFAPATSMQTSAIEDIYFDFDSWQITERGKHALEADAHWLKVNSDVTVTIEGHCDARGTQDYNLVLGKKRAEAVKAYLVDLGVEPNRISVVSYGEERPFCTAPTETCYQQNRRGHFVVTQ
ncbi:MAG: peptidoglycan-associated lipoprotein Pal [Nitrospirae bacterium]|nr:MAG: peptidoglycan-associated lipoprotein Pal [Nitrospirota bacterium]